MRSFGKRHRFSSQKCRTPKRPPSQSYVSQKYEYDFLNNINNIVSDYEPRLILNGDETQLKSVNIPRCVWGKKGNYYLLLSFSCHIL